MNLHLLPSTPAATPDRLPLSRLRVQRPPVLHRPGSYISVKDATLASITHVDAHLRTRTVAQRGQSSPCVTAVLIPGDRPTPVAITPPARTVRAAVETLETVTESGCTPSAPAPKAIVTFLRPWVTRHPANKGRAGLSVSTVVGSDGLIAYRVMEVAYRLTSSQPNPLPGAGALLHRRGTPTPIITRQCGGNIIAPERSTGSTMQRPSEPQLIADELDNIIPFIRRKFAENGIDQEEQAILDHITGCSDRALRHAEIFDFTASVNRIGFNKRNARRLRELFPELGPGIA